MYCSVCTASDQYRCEHQRYSGRLCVHCGKDEDEHADRKCLWDATDYERYVIGPIWSHLEVALDARTITLFQIPCPWCHRRQPVRHDGHWGPTPWIKTWPLVKRVKHKCNQCHGISWYAIHPD